MKQIELNCETITPLFMSGADGMTPELRAPSIKALVRYWWRAANANMDMQKMLDTEKNIFGGTGNKPKLNNDNEKNEEYGRSKVVIRIKYDNSNYICKDLSCEVNKENNIGIWYMLYSTVMGRRPYIKCGMPFSILLNFKDEDQEAINEFLKGLVFLEYFGAIGTRSRRGAGSFRVIKINGDTEYIKDDIKTRIVINGINNNEELKNMMEELSGSLKEPVNKNYSILKGSRVLIFESKDTWIDALEFTGEKFKNFRFNKQGDIYNTPNFGLPVLHHSRNDHKTNMIGKKPCKGDRITRRSSPLIFKIIKTDKDKYFPVITHLNGEFLPKDYNIANQHDKNDLGKSPDINIINNFLDTFDKKEYKEITL